MQRGGKRRNLMLQSVITRKGQTTIPKEIRELLKLKPNDKLFYIVEEDKVILKPIRGNILELRGSITSKGRKLDFEEIRKVSRKKISRRIAEVD